MAAIILVGEKSKRMGKNKALLKINGRCLIEHVIDRLSIVFKDVLIVTPLPASFRFLNKQRVKIVKDVVFQKGPLGGIYTGLFYSRDKYNFICGCDMPFLNWRLLKAMVSMTADIDILVPLINGFLEPLHSIYSRRCIKSIEKHLKADDLKIKKIFSEVRCRYLPQELIKKYDPTLFSFFNLNTTRMFHLANKTSAASF